MPTIKTIYRLLSIVFVFMMVGSGVMAFEGDDLEKFKRSEKLVLSNVGEGIQSLSDLKMGISLLEEMLMDSNKNTHVHRVLADGYRTIGRQVHKKNTVERTEFLDKEKEVLRLALEIEPENTRLLWRYSICFRGEERAKIKERILAIDKDNADAYASLGLYNAVSLKNPEKGLEYAWKAYDLAKDLGGKKRFGNKLMRVLSLSANKNEIVNFRMRYLKETNALRNPEPAREIKVTLEYEQDTEVFQGDVPFTVVFTNTSEDTLVLPNHVRPDLNVFHFQIFPERSLKDLVLRNPQKLSVDPSIAETVKIKPGESFRVKLNLSELFPLVTSRELSDGGYIMFLKYVNSTRGFLYSDPIHFEIRNFVNNESTLSVDDFNLSIELEGQGNSVSGDVPFSVVFLNNTDKAINIYDSGDIISGYYTFHFKKIGESYRYVKLPEFDRTTFDFENPPTVSIEPGQKFSIQSSLSGISPELGKLDDGRYRLGITYSSSYGGDAIFQGRLKTRFTEFNVINTE